MSSTTLSIVVPLCAFLVTVGVIVYKVGKLSSKFDHKFDHLSDLHISHKTDNEKEFRLIREDIKELSRTVFDLNAQVSSNTATLKIVHEDVKRLEDKSPA